MLERNFYNEEFEELLRDKTDQYKMYPSDKVWKGIYSTLHTRRKRFITGMSVLISSILFFAGKELLTPAKPSAIIKKIASNGADAKIAETKPISQVNPILAFSGLKKENFLPTSSAPTAFEPAYKLDLENPAEASLLSEDPTGNSANNHPTEISAIMSNAFSPSSPEPKIVPSRSVFEQLTIIVNNSSKDPDMKTDGLLSAKARIREKSMSSDEVRDHNQINWLAENASLNLSSVKKYKSEWQLYFSPTANYRKLSVGNQYTNQKPFVQNVPIAPMQYGNANNFIDNNPAVGFQVGSSYLYRLTRNLSLRAGLQFNYSLYTIKTYTSSQPQQATIVLNSISPNSGLPQTLTNYSNIQNFGGKFPSNLENQYFQFSAPVGLEMRIIGNGRLQFNIAGSIMPTYLLNRNAYLLTTDYSSYTQDPSLFRKWNLNGVVEAFISYRLGAFRWQIGPQFGYQLLSTYTNKYPLKENLMEYGIKIGITKTIR